MEKNDSNKKEESQNNKNDIILNSTNIDAPSEKNEKNCNNCRNCININNVHDSQIFISSNSKFTFVNSFNDSNKFIIVEANINNNKIKDDNKNTTNKGIYSGSKIIHKDNDIINLKK